MNLVLAESSEVSSTSYQQEFYRLEASFPTYFAHGSQKMAWSKESPDKVYFLGAAAESKQDRDVLYQYTFFVLGLDNGTHAAKVLGKMPLGEGNIKKPIAPLELIMLDTQTVYLQMPDEITLIDVGDDTQPRIITKLKHQNCIGSWNELTPLYTAVGCSSHRPAATCHDSICLSQQRNILLGRRQVCGGRKGCSPRVSD